MLPADAAGPELCIRPYVAQDQAGVAEVFIDGCQFYRDSFPPHDWTDFIRESLEADLARIESVYVAPGGNFWVVTTPNAAEEGERVVGIVGLEAKGDGVGELRRMAISSNFRRHGLGRRLVAELERWAKSHGYRRIVLGNGGSKDDARAFYRALGYQDVGMKLVSEEPRVEVFELAKDLQ